MNRFEKKPFAIIGVNLNRFEPQKLKEVMEKEKLPWRSFVDRGDITAQWNHPGTPTLYALDHRGTIRFKWLGSPGEKALDAALEQLVQAAEEESRKPPK